MYTENSRIMLWRNKKKKAELEEYAKGIKKINTFFKSAFGGIRSSKLILIDIKTDLYIYLKKFNQLCLIGKFKKENHNIFTYNYICLLSVC